MPTLLDLVGAETKAPENIDGVSIAQTLLGEKQPKREFLYREFTGYGGQQSVWLGNRWKGIRQEMLRKGKGKDAERDPLTIELYDLDADIAESKDVAAQNPEIVDEVRKLMEQEHTPSEVFAFPILDGQ